jgi:hypothetical protein
LAVYDWRGSVSHQDRLAVPPVPQKPAEPTQPKPPAWSYPSIKVQTGLDGEYRHTKESFSSRKEATEKINFYNAQAQRFCRFCPLARKPRSLGYYDSKIIRPVNRSLPGPGVLGLIHRTCSGIWLGPSQSLRFLAAAILWSALAAKCVFFGGSYSVTEVSEQLHRLL